MGNDLPETGTVESLKIMVNTIKQYCLPEYPENDKGQKPFIGVVLDEVVKEIEESICRQETLQETAAADAKYIAAIPALCRGEEVPCALHVSQPINELRARIAALEKMVELLTSCWHTKDLHAEMYFYDVPYPHWNAYTGIEPLRKGDEVKIKIGAYDVITKFENQVSPSKAYCSTFESSGIVDFNSITHYRRKP